MKHCRIRIGNNLYFLKGIKNIDENTKSIIFTNNFSDAKNCDNESISESLSTLKYREE
jgi:hypothetical protein